MDDGAGVGAARQRRDRVPRNGQRERVLAMVRQHDGPIDAVEIAEQIGLHVTTVRFHLDALCDDGVVLRTRLSRSGAGRPRTGYLPVAERLDYRALAEVLAMELGQSAETRGRRAQRAGRKWAARMVALRGDPDRAASPADADADDPLDHAAAQATSAFTSMGFAAELDPAARSASKSSVGDKPEPQRERVIRLHACPVRGLARSHPEVACGVHRGLLQGLLGEADGDAGSRPALSAQLEPLVEPELCVVRLEAG